MDLRCALVWAALLVLFTACAPALARNCTSQQTGNWNATNTWQSGCSGGPVSGDTVTIQNNHTVRVNANAVADSLTINGGANNSTLTYTGAFLLTINGNVIVNAPTANNITKLIEVPAGARLTVNGNLTLNGGSSGTRRATLRLGADAASVVTVTGNIAVTNGTAAVIEFQGPGTLNVRGNLASGATFTASTGTVAYNGSGAQSIGTYTYNNLTINKPGGSATASSAVTAASLDIDTISGAVTVNASFNATTAALSTAAGAALNMTGNLSATTAAFATAGNGAITVNGAVSATSATFTNAATGPVTISGALTATNLTFASGNAGLTSVGASSTAGALTFAAGNTGRLEMTGGSTLTVTGNCTTSVTRAGSGHVIGNLRLTFPNGSPTCTYPVGDSNNYTPITLALTGATAGTITGSVTAGAPPNLSVSPLSGSNYVNRYWTLGATGDTAGASSYDATLNWVPADVPGGASFAAFMVAQYRGGWVVPDPAFSGNTATSIMADNVATAFSTASVFAVGEAYACLPPANAPVAVSCQCDRFGRPNLNPSTIFGSNWLLSTSSGAFGIPKITNPGFLRLTDNTGNNSSAATVPGIFPAAGNWVSVEFRNYAYNGSGADGIAVTLSDYSVAPTPGAFGGSLGYAQKTGIDGFAGGWIGVALDEYGNYANNTEGRVGGAGGTGLYPDSIGVRGSGSGTTGYNWLGGALNIGNIDNAGSATPANGYMYQVIVDARNYAPANQTALVSVRRDTTGTGNAYANAVAPFDAYVVNPAQAPVPVNWQISFTGSTGGSTNIHEISNLKICAQTFIPPTATTMAAGFNAIDSALPNTKQNALFGHIYMKVANVPFRLNVAALLPEVGGVSQGVNTVFASGGNRTVTVRLIDDSQPGGPCNASDAACSACSKPVVATQNLTFTAADGGFKQTANFTVNGAYKRLIAQVIDTVPNPDVYGCSTDAFSVRPATYALSASVAAPTKAGTPFTITATPRNPGNANIAGTTGAPLLDNTKAPVVNGIQTLLQQSWSPGASSGTFIFNDVGTFSLPANAIYDAQFGNAAGEAQDRTNGDCNPGSGSPYAPAVCYGYSGAACNAPATAGPADSSGKYGCDIGSQAFSLTSPARFYPDHYEASLAATQACSADGFSYMGQPFSMTSAAAGAMQIKALAAGQTFATAPGLPSYTGSYTPRANVWFGAQNGVGSTTDLIRCISSTQNPTANRCLATTLPYKTATSNAWTVGSFTVAPTTYYFDPPKDATTTPDSTWGPYDSLSVGVTVSDADGATLTIPGGQSFVLNGDTYQSVNGSLPMRMRYGRMRIQNASGSEQTPLLLPVWLEYWSGSAWMPNLLDTACTRLLGPPPTAFGGNTAAAACYGGAPASGMQCTSATAGGVGSIYMTQLSNVPANSGVPSYNGATFSFGQRNLILAAPKAAGTLGVSVQAPPWLKTGPVNIGGTNPSATVRYSSYNSRFIFLRENY